MKNKDYQILFNPFNKIAGIKSLLLGLIATIIIIAISYFSHTRFDGVLDIHCGIQSPFLIYVMDNLISWLSLIIVFYPLSLFTTRFRARFLDVAGTMLLSRFPLIIPSFICFYLNRCEISNFFEAKFLHTNVEYSVQTMDWILFFVAIITIIIVTIWYIALLYQAFKVNTNLKGIKATVIFIVSLLLAEILSKLALMYTGNFSLTINL
jgi:hypothetical protein